MKILYLNIFLILIFNIGNTQKKLNFEVKKTYFKKDTINIEQYGAIGDGFTNNKIHINRAITDLNLKGGGVILIPRGFWLTGPINLKSNINLHLAKGAILCFSPNFNEYPLVVSSFEGVNTARCQSPISAENQENIGITGEGILDGNGLFWRPIKKDKLTDFEWNQHIKKFKGVVAADGKTWYPSTSALEGSKTKDIGKLIDGKKLSDFEYIKDFLRPNFIRINNCSQVLIENVTIENSPAWTIHILLSKHITLKNVSVKNPSWAQNTDAVDLESSQFALIEDCNFDTGDDGITIKSGRDEEGRKLGVPTAFVIVKNTTVYHAHGGFVVGSEMSGGVHDIYVNNCTFIGTDIGLRFKTTRGRGGVVQNIFIDHILMKDIVGDAIFLDMYYTAVDPISMNTLNEKAQVSNNKFEVNEGTPIFKNFFFNNIYCQGAKYALFIRGLPEMPIENINIQNANIASKEGIFIQYANNINLKNAKITTLNKNKFAQFIDAINIDIDTHNLKNEFPLDNYAEKMAFTAMKLWPDSFAPVPNNPSKWSYDQGVILKGIEQLWKLTANGNYFEYIKHSMDFYLKEENKIFDYSVQEYNIDNLNNGKALLMLYEVTGNEKYKKALRLLKKQIDSHPRNEAGGFWHKKIYPNQMWLDGLYMGAAFYAEYAAIMNEPLAFDDIAHQFILIYEKTYDSNTGLLYHAYDESKQQQWANPISGTSPNFWARALGWYGMALVDALDYFPQNHPKRNQLIKILQQFDEAIIKYQDNHTGVWFDLIALPQQKNNYLESSASSMFVYVLLKSIRQGYISERYLQQAYKGYHGLIKQFTKINNDLLELTGTVKVSGLGGKPYRNGSVEYYLSEPVITNDPKGIGAFILASTEYEISQIPKIAKNKTVLLDCYYNNEWSIDFNGYKKRIHYMWHNFTHGGYGFLGNLFTYYGAKIDTLNEIPTAENLAKANVYIIVDPDNLKDNSMPNYLQKKAMNTILSWVKQGGTLLIFANDSVNCSLSQINDLLNPLGVQFLNSTTNPVYNNHFEQGMAIPYKFNKVFNKNLTMYIKEAAPLIVNKTAQPIAIGLEHNLMATIDYGQGKILVVSDPWLYNEYVDGRKLTSNFKNWQAAHDIIEWIFKTKN
ncbi:MAG: glycoside hydrolase family 88 protein [Sediminibacterium sp.]|nr:glycoside hydrolase family 88 protein [Sediminibacterium sp.]